MRDKAQQALGAKFSLSAFHDEVIGAGALPMDVFEQRMNQWIARTAVQGGPSSNTDA